jgi:hypothetical protein
MRYNHLDMLPEKAFQPIGKRMTLEGGGKGGGSAPAPSSQTVTNTSIPEYARPYVETMLGKTEALTDINQNPYQTYGGQRIAEFSPMQQQAFGNVGNMQTAPQLGQATNATAGVMAAAANNQYNPMQTSYLGANAPSLNQYQMGPASQVRTQDFNRPGTAQQFMNPYLSASLQPQLAEIGRQYDITGQQEKSQATGQGAFGGNRQALMQAENARNKNTAMNTAIGQGYNTAFNNAQQQFNAQQNANLQAQQANQQAGLSTGIQNLQSALQTQGLGSGQNLQAQLANQGAFGNAQQLAANQQQFGANIGQQNLQQILAGAGQLGQLGQTQFGQQQGINTAQQQVGAVQQAQAQQNLDQGYQDFLKQQNYPYQQLAFMSDMTRGLPLSQSAATQYTAPPSMVSQLGGLGMAGLGAYGAAGGFKQPYKEGGIISAYKDGGKVGYSVGGDISTMTDRQLTELLSNPQLNPMEMKAVEDLLALHRRMEINPQTSQIMAQNQGIDAIPTGDMVPETMAGGGIIAFKTGKTVKASNAEDMDTEIADLKNIIKTQNAEMWSSSPTAKSDALQAQYAKQALADKEAEPWNFVRDLGLGAAAGTSQYALSNIGAGGTYANTEAGKRGAAADANDKLALMQQIESEKSQEARKASMLNANQSSLTQLYNNRNTRDSIQATREATAQQRLDTLDSKERNAAASNFKTVYDYAYGLLTKANNNPLETPPDNKLTDDQIDKIATKRALAALPAAHKQYYSQYAPAPTSTASTPYEQYKVRFAQYANDPAKQKQLTDYARQQGVVK